MLLTVKQDPKNVRVYGLVAELSRRCIAIMRHLPDMVAAKVLDDIQSSAPRGIAGYPNMLKLRQLHLSGVISTVGIVVPGYSYSHRLKEIDATKIVLFVNPVQRKGAPDAGVVVLANHNPWTMDTLPYEPDRQKGSITSRKVTPREVRILAAQRRHETKEVMRELKEAGVKPFRQHPVKLERKVSRDIGFEVLRSEFGLETAHHAHWRPAIRRARRTYVMVVMKKLVRWLAVPSERRWKRPLTTKPERAATAKKIQQFQDFVRVSSR